METDVCILYIGCKNGNKNNIIVPDCQTDYKQTKKLMCKNHLVSDIKFCVLDSKLQTIIIIIFSTVKSLFLSRGFYFDVNSSDSNLVNSKSC